MDDFGAKFVTMVLRIWDDSKEDAAESLTSAPGITGFITGMRGQNLIGPRKVLFLDGIIRGGEEEERGKCGMQRRLCYRKVLQKGPQKEGGPKPPLNPSKSTIRSDERTIGESG